MNPRQFTRYLATWGLAGLGIGAASYAAYASLTWLRFGKPKKAHGDQADPLLNLFMPHYEIADRHEIGINAPAEVALSAAAEMDLESCALIRAIFKGREWILRSKPDDKIRRRGFVQEMKALGWGVLAELPGREIVMGGVTQPWEANPVFRALPPDAFAAFHDPGYVKIAWTLRADPSGDTRSVFLTETRAVATDPESRKRFRRYWSFLSPGIIAIRRAMLPVVKSDAEERWQRPAA
jgi:hypothetical protein